MSITSSATATRDWEVPSPNSYHYRLLLIIITKGDGTPIDASSILEEDIIEICVWRALCVLQYSVAESVILVTNLEDVNCIHCNLPDVMELHDEAVTVQTMAPAEAHIAASTAMWHSNQTTGDGELHTPPYQTPPSKETPHCLHTQLGDLNDSELHQLVKDLMQEIAKCKLIAPPATPLHMTGHIHWAVERLRKMTGRSPFQEGEGRVQRGKPPQFHIHQLGKSSLWTTTAITLSCTGRTRYGATHHCPNFGSANWHPQNKHLQWWHGTWQNQGVLQAVEPQGAMYKGPLSRIGGQREYYAVSEGSSGRYGLLYGLFCWCIWNFRETFCNIWYGCIVWCINAKFLQNLTR